MNTERMKYAVLPALLLVLLVWGGCSRRRDVFTNLKSPHPSGWNDESSPSFHGIFVNRDGGPKGCDGCHTVSLTDSSSYCFNSKCHFGPTGRPHPPDWTDSSKVGFHGIRVVNYGLNTVVNGRTRPCTDCHYVSNKDTLSWCFRGCHDGPVGANKPPRNPTIRGHREAWKTASANPRSLIFHGEYVAHVGFAYCQDCHGANFQGDIGPSCGTAGCHTFGSGFTFFPHQPYWTDSTSQGFHGRFVLQQGKGICQSCHGEDFNGKYNQKPCFPCHDYPHPEPAVFNDTLQDNFHGMRVWSYGYDNCKICHGDTSLGFTGGRVNVSCFDAACHATGLGGLEERDRWRLKAPTNRLWHGNVIGRNGFGGCRTCHGANFNYNPPPGGINSRRVGCAFNTAPCHQIPFNFVQWGWVPHDTPKWADGDTLPAAGDTTHAWWVNSVRGRDSTSCSPCHYPMTIFWRDGTLSPTCQSCHLKG